MVKYQEPSLDTTFAALSDPTRRALLARLEQEEAVSVSELARPFPVSLPAIMKHLDVLSDAGLITREKAGRTVSCRLNAAPMEEAMGWLRRYERFWREKLDALEAYFNRPRKEREPDKHADKDAAKDSDKS
ncbi:ArsR/SmtB family transcription factor [Bosea sp. (in: a-proteobacteria)]|jgi:DNA-binding transcriptional ArsR family regulator|uniref:ArsR/SmtB family transcription factor n=1 Tax=Bosea sp. (in: a-proteobacteria) TaxID=1871050 RepID=UPI003F72BDB3